MVCKFMVVNTFIEVINETLNKGIITEEEIRLEFGISKATFQKWMEGKNGPHPAMQKLILKYIEDKS